MKLFSIKLLAVLILTQTIVFAQENELDGLFKNFEHFDLREALANRKDSDSTELLFYRGVIANRFNDLDNSAKLLKKYIKKVRGNAPHLPEAYEILADNYTKEFEYGKAADTYRFLLDNFRANLDADRAKSYENVFGLWNSLRNTNKQTIDFKGDSNIQGTRDVAKLLNIPVEIGGIKQDFVFDTGAGLSTMSVSTANKLGLTIIEADVSVGSATNINVRSKLAVVSILKIGNATIRNVIFLVLEDKSLSFPQANYQIHGIIGFPVIQSLGKVSISKDGQVSIFARSEKSLVEPNMCLQGLVPIIAGYYQNKRLMFAFDTGAVTTEMYQPFFKANKAEITKDQIPVKVKLGGAGGFSEVTAYRLPNIDINIGGKIAKLVNARVLSEVSNENSRYYHGNLGQDVIKQFDRMTLDFRTMQINFD